MLTKMKLGGPSCVEAAAILANEWTRPLRKSSLMSKIILSGRALFLLFFLASGFCPLRQARVLVACNGHLRSQVLHHKLLI